MNPAMDSTCDLAQAATAQWDVVVVGAGPAGSLAARQLSLAGVKVLLVDRDIFPRFKVCGGCLNPRALNLLNTVGLGSLVEQAGARPVECLRLSTATGRQAELKLPGGRSLSRQAFDLELARAAINAGVSLLQETQARLDLTTTSSTSRRVHLSHRKQGTSTVSATVVLAADGLAGQFLSRGSLGRAGIRPHSRIGAGTTCELPTSSSLVDHGVIHMACGKDGYVGLVRVEGNRVNVAAAMDQSHVRRHGGLGPAAARILQTTAAPLSKVLLPTRWWGTPHLTRYAPVVATERCFALGDATGYIEPFTGEGITWAMEAALRVVPLVCTALEEWNPALANDWRTDQQRRRQGRWMCRSLALLLRSSSLTEAAVRLLSHAPFLAAPFIHLLNRSQPNPLQTIGGAK